MLRRILLALAEWLICDLPFSEDPTQETLRCCFSHQKQNIRDWWLWWDNATQLRWLSGYLRKRPGLGYCCPNAPSSWAGWGLHIPRLGCWISVVSDSCVMIDHHWWILSSSGSLLPVRIGSNVRCWHSSRFWASSLSFLYPPVIIQSSTICLSLPLAHLPSILPLMTVLNSLFPIHSLSYCALSGLFRVQSFPSCVLCSV